MKVLDKKNAERLLEELGSQYKVIVPLRSGGDLNFGDPDPQSQSLDYKGITHYSAKGLFFPESEALLTFEIPGRGETGTIGIKDHLHDAKTVIWGVRPCDLTGFKVLDAFFLSDPVDPYYQARRMHTVLIALNCNEAGKNCFCKSLAAGPFAHEGFDLALTDLGDEFVVETGSEAGQKLIEEHSELFSDASEAQEDKARALEEKSKGSFAGPLDAAKLRAKLPTAYESPLWEEQVAKCKVCGTCCFVCPTCHCFNIEDLKKSKKVAQRMRYWDSCQLSGFTQMAGHNSRPNQAERWRQKVLDKFMYIPHKYNGLLGCVGCGRCVDHCQAGIKIVEVLGRVADE
jgi:ferredoxin